MLRLSYGWAEAGQALEQSSARTWWRPGSRCSGRVLGICLDVLPTWMRTRGPHALAPSPVRPRKVHPLIPPPSTTAAHVREAGRAANQAGAAITLGGCFSQARLVHGEGEIANPNPNPNPNPTPDPNPKLSIYQAASRVVGAGVPLNTRASLQQSEAASLIAAATRDWQRRKQLAAPQGQTSLAGG